MIVPLIFCIFLFFYISCWNLCLLCSTLFFSLHNSGHPAIAFHQLDGSHTHVGWEYWPWTFV